MHDLEKGLPVPSASIQEPEQVHCSSKNEPGYESSVRNGHRDSTATCAQSLSSTPLDPIHVHKTSSESRCRAHLTILGAFLALFCTFGQMNAFGTFQNYYHAHQLVTYEASTISWIGSLQLWIFFFSGGFVGWLFDIYGPKPLMSAGTLCFVVSLMMTSISTQYYQYLLGQGILFGLGVGLIFYPSMASVSTHFVEYRATALGIAAAGSSLGGVMYPIMLQQLFEKVGFGWTVRISGLLSGVLCLVAIFTVSASRHPEKHAGRSGLSVNKLQDARFLLLAADFAELPVPHGLALSPQTSFLALAVMNGGGVFGRIAPAILSDVIGRFNLLAPSAFLSGLLTIACWLSAKNTAGLMVYSVLYGFWSGSFIGVITPCVAQISDIREIGSRIGCLYTIISFPSLVGGPIAGALLSHAQGSFTPMIVFSGITVMAGSFFILGAKLAIDPKLLARV
ncbi:monocarboxylate permease-like protein [Moniliophthora roreri]|nr:monocarboxylate permease-like protein [Moniliophthora roreri]